MGRAIWPRRSWSHAFLYWLTKREQEREEPEPSSEERFYNLLKPGNGFFRDV